MGVFLTAFGVVAVIAVISLTTSSDDAPAEPEAQDANESDATNEPVDEDRVVTFGRRLAGNVDELRRLIGPRKLAYMGDEVVVLVDPDASIAVREFAAENGTLPDYIFRLADFDLLVNGADVFGVIPESEEVIRLSTAGPLVRDALGGFAVINTREGQPTEMLLSSGARMDLSSLAVPAGAGRLDVQDVGVLITPASGGTYLARPGGFIPFADGLVLVATPTHHLETTCDAELACQIDLVDRATQARDPLPAELTSGQQGFSLSPNGRWILIKPQDAPMQLYDTARRTVDVLAVDVPFDAAWAGDDHVVVWFAPGTTRPILQAFTPDTLTFETLDLGDLLAVDRTSDALALLD